MKLVSVKQRVALTSVLLCLAVITASTTWVYFDTRRAVNDIDDARLEDLSESFFKVLLFTDPSVIGADKNSDPQSLVGNLNSKTSPQKELENWSKSRLLEDNFAYLLFDSDGKIIAQSPNSPPLDMSIMKEPGLNDIQDNKHDNWWRGITMFLAQPNGKSDLWLWLGEDKKVRSEVENEIAIPAILPLLITTPVLCFLLVLFTYHLFTPINRLEQELSTRCVDNLSPLNIPDIPEEIHSLVDKLNYLFSQLSSAWQREKRFHQDAAHELRTPLTVIKLNVQNALNAMTIEQKNADLSCIEQSITRSERTIEQLLTLAKIESGHTITLDKNVDVIDTIRNVIADLVPLALKQNQNIELRTNADSLFLQGNEILLSCLLRNLIDNAIRYSGKGTHITTSVHKIEQNISIVISDNGLGMSQADINRIFERFFRVKTSTQQSQGTGLGMAICERVIDLHNGMIEVISQNPGIAFNITLPIKDNHFS
jgi:two-component system sensor histidine kinase QseC